MKQSKNLCALLPVGFLAAGGAGWFLLRQILNTLDDRGLIIPGTAAQIALWVLTAAAAAAAVIPARKCVLGEGGRVGGIGELLMAAGCVTLLNMTMSGPAVLQLVHRVLLFAAVAALAVSGVLRLIGKEPHFALQVPMALFTIAHLVVCYQQWSERPQLLVYIFGVGGVLCLMLFAYGLLERAAGMKCRFFTVWAGLTGIFFAGAAAAQGDTDVFFAAAAGWMALEMTALKKGD